MGLDLRADPIALTAALVDIPSESRHEQRIADEVEAALREQTTGFEIIRNGNAVLARTDLGRPSRVMLAGHLDTVPAADNVPSRRVGRRAARLRHLRHEVRRRGVPAPGRHRRRPRARHHAGHVRLRGDRGRRPTGLGRIERELPDWLHADVAILGRAVRRLHRGGLPGHAARRRQRRRAPGRIRRDRGWATTPFTSSAPCSTGCRPIRPRSVDIDGCTYREGLSAVRIDGGVAGNVIPDAASVTVNFRFAPDRSVEQAAAHVHEVLDGLDVDIEQTDAASGALPGLTKPAAAALVEAAGGQVRAKYGWTDVARFAALGIPAVNYGPGDPNLAHRVDERVAGRRRSPPPPRCCGNICLPDAVYHRTGGVR